MLLSRCPDMRVPNGNASLTGVEQAFILNREDCRVPYGVEQAFMPAAEIILYLCHSDRARRPRSFATGESEREWRNPGNLSIKHAASGSSTNNLRVFHFGFFGNFGDFGNALVPIPRFCPLRAPLCPLW
jgi:hypothetical protein